MQVKKKTRSYRSWSFPMTTYELGQKQDRPRIGLLFPEEAFDVQGPLVFPLYFHGEFFFYSNAVSRHVNPVTLGGNFSRCHLLGTLGQGIVGRLSRNVSPF